MAVLGQILAVGSLAIASIWLLVLLWKFTVKALKGNWDNREVKLAATIRKNAKGFCWFLGVAMCVAYFSYFLMALEWESEHYEILAWCALVAVVCYPVICSLVLFVAEIFASRLESQIKAGKYAEKIYNYMLKQNGEEPELPIDTDGKFDLSFIKNLVPMQNKNQQDGWFCTACGKKNNNNSNFCNNCGNSKA